MPKATTGVTRPRDKSIERFGFSNPVLIADDAEIVACHGLVAAAKLICSQWHETDFRIGKSPTAQAA
jgi:hypothetical protein